MSDGIPLVSSSLQGLGFMDPGMCEAVRQLCMLAAHEHSEQKLATLVKEIYHLVSVSPPNGVSSAPVHEENTSIE